jgi:hypothetical protein
MAPSAICFRPIGAPHLRHYRRSRYSSGRGPRYGGIMIRLFTDWRLIFRSTFRSPVGIRAVLACTAMRQERTKADLI